MIEKRIPLIKVVNLKKREDRKQSMIKQFEKENVTNYEFIEAVNGLELPESEELQLLFEQNNFGYKKSVIGCALSHLQIYYDLSKDVHNEYYVVLEDDVDLMPNFNEDLQKITDEFVKQDIEHLALALSLGNNESDIKTREKVPGQIEIFEKDVYKLWNITFAYIISKKAATKIIKFLNGCSIKSACDNPHAYGEVIRYHYTSKFIVKHPPIEVVGSDITNNSNCFNFITTKKSYIKISFCDWWDSEYCGGSFDPNNNFIIDILRKYGDIENNEILVVEAHHDFQEKPDIIFYSIFGNYHKYFPNTRKVFFSGEPFSKRPEAAFNFTFDRNCEDNIRFPLWLGYLNDALITECNNRKNGLITIPKRDKFCSFISNGEVKTTNRRVFVELLSAYKKVDCGGQFLNNIGYTVPRGINCSGKIEHNNNYKFAIAFENEDYPGYVTEKLCDIYKSGCIPIYWGTSEVTRDFNPSTFINARDFESFDKLVEYVIKVDNDDILYASYFKEPFFSNKWMDAFNDPSKIFYKNLADCIIGKEQNLVTNYFRNANNPNKKEKWVIYAPNMHTFKLIEDYINNLNNKYHIKYVTTINEIKSFNPSKILILNSIHDSSIFDIFKNAEICILNIDSMYISYFFNALYTTSLLYPNIKVYDYSLANIKILNEHNINCEFLEYENDENETLYLQEMNQQSKIYDFGIVCYLSDASCSPRRKCIVDTLRNKGFSVNIVCGFKRERDIELGKCRIILNIHHRNINFDIECRTFEHLRCNRLLNAGFLLLSEVSYIDDAFIEKYPNLKFINYEDFDKISRENVIYFDSIINKESHHLYPSKSVNVFNIWHNKLFDKCYEKLDEYSLSKITMFDVNPNYEKVYNTNKGYKIVKEYDLSHYNSLFQITNYCQTSCLYHVFKNQLHLNSGYIGFIQYDMDLASDFIYDIETKINTNLEINNNNNNNNNNTKFFYTLVVENKLDVPMICQPYNNSVLEKYNEYFKTNHSYESIKSSNKSSNFICLHTFVIPVKIYIKMMVWFCSLTDWLHRNYINGLYCESMSEVSEEIFGLFLLLQMIENEQIELHDLKLHHEWPNLHNETVFNNYKEGKPHYSLDKIVDSRNTDKNTCHSYLETYESLFKAKQISCKNVLEIGVQSGSMKLMNDYFVNADIYGIDVNNTCSSTSLSHYERIKIVKINAYSQESVNYFLSKNIKFDVIIDDGPHSLESMIYFVKNYSQLLTNNGILIVEDIPDINWCTTLIDNIDESLKKFIGIYDLRQIKNRWDDILLVINKTTNVINTMNTDSIDQTNMIMINKKFQELCYNWSDINEHLPTLCNYAKECESVIELGVRGCISSWAFAKGLIENNKQTKRMFLNDIEICDINDFLQNTSTLDIDINYEWKSDLEIEINENYDITFIDTWHIYGQLKRELDKFSKITNKYIIMHDTTVDEFTGESIRMGLSKTQIIDLSHKTGFSVYEIETGLWPAIQDFLNVNKEWILHERYYNNNGLTILKRVQPIMNALEINPKIKIEYGINDCRIDVTQDALNKCINKESENILFIPQYSYERAALFGDPLFGINKSIFINGIEYKDDGSCIFYNLLDGIISFEEPVKSICFDIGANVGAWALKNVDLYDKIISVEADESTFIKIKNNVTNNNKIVPINYAVCDSSEEYIKFYKCDSDVLSTLNKDWLDGGKSRFHLNYTEILCKTISIDKLIDLYGMPELIKIDVEQGEFDCIKSLTKKVKQLCFEWASEFFDISLNCLNYLYKLGFRHFFVQFTDDYTFRPSEYYSISQAKQILNNTTPKNEWGMVWCK